MGREDFSGEQKYSRETLESRFGKLQFGPEKARGFEESQVFSFKKEDNTYVFYALRRDAQGNLEGNEFILVDTNDGGQRKNGVSSLPGYNDGKAGLITGSTYEMHQEDLEMIEELLKQEQIAI